MTDKAESITCPKCNEDAQWMILYSAIAYSNLVDGTIYKGPPSKVDTLSEGKHVHFMWEGYTDYDLLDEMGVMCGHCGWEYRGDDWQEYLSNAEEREKERIKAEFLKELQS